MKYFSMGSIMMHYFLQQQTLAWKEKHIRCEEKKHIRCLKRLGKLQVEDNNSIYNDPHRSFLSVMSVTILNLMNNLESCICRALVSVAGVWGGTARALKVFAIGDNLDSWSELGFYIMFTRPR